MWRVSEEIVLIERLLYILSNSTKRRISIKLYNKDHGSSTGTSYQLRDGILTSWRRKPRKQNQPSGLGSRNSQQNFMTIPYSPE
ncbi:hypothetical protein H5410_020347 [Solanum commersonii]|uniref:Uncharacterized protein n=1 Tax=Solanum commersonii TaxID=4109 RepID=A0A9J5Z8T0_SOLCO|nr:hypothetical protein H5410_020347 [Solanum commersonii]